jgi:hypothetical protein
MNEKIYICYYHKAYKCSVIVFFKYKIMEGIDQKMFFNKVLIQIEK